MKFTKMHGLGNDYIYVNCFEESIENPAELAKAVSDRHFGIGSDGLITVGPSDSADVRMRIFNADGSEAEMCGNGIRCVAKFAYERKLTASRGSFSVPGQPACPASMTIETGNGVLTVGLVIDETERVVSVCVNMGQPILEAEQIPVSLGTGRVIREALEVGDKTLEMTCVSMGNPHAVFFTENVRDVPLEAIGPVIENHRLFPNRTNVHFVQLMAVDEFRIRTWERGSGITLACGTGACACCVAAVLNGFLERQCTAHLPGGDLSLNWCPEDNCVYMTGPAVEVFTGEFKL